MSKFTSYSREPKVLVLDEELTWTEAYTGATSPRFKRWKLIPLSQYLQCQPRR